MPRPVSSGEAIARLIAVSFARSTMPAMHIAMTCYFYLDLPEFNLKNSILRVNVQVFPLGSVIHFARYLLPYILE